ncbi:NADP-dependent oxidoreductase [Coralloluteibacterium thermophilus]|uniref:NADP-dependent oxidoreductase n=1 Tax=Coralloluteibacterium thermophilum TaxID=2707049 RepID=UPI003672B919
MRVVAAGLQPWDLAQRSGWFALGRDDDAFRPRPLGCDFAGIVEAVGDNVRDLLPGDEVLGWSDTGAHREHVVVPEAQLVRRPAGLSWIQAAALVASGQSALAALEALGVAPGDRLLVHGAAGGVGSMAVQLARLRGAQVVGTAREANHDYLRALGATPVRYGEGLLARLHALLPSGADAALDAAGGEAALQASLALVPDPARIGSLVDFARAEAAGARPLRVRCERRRLLALAQFAGSGRLHVHVRRVFDLVDAAAAHRALAQGHGCGKIVLWMGRPAAPAAATRRRHRRLA